VEFCENWPAASNSERATTAALSHHDVFPWYFLDFGLSNGVRMMIFFFPPSSPDFSSLTRLYILFFTLVFVRICLSSRFCYTCDPLSISFLNFQLNPNSLITTVPIQPEYSVVYNYCSGFTWPVEGEPTESFETSSTNLIHTPCENPKTKKHHSHHGKCFKTCFHLRKIR
jgi:hypothetical protein